MAKKRVCGDPGPGGSKNSATRERSHQHQAVSENHQTKYIYNVDALVRNQSPRQNKRTRKRYELHQSSE